MVCQYCNKRLGLLQRLKGQSFCSAEHQELHFGLSFERLRASVSETTAIKPKPLWPPNRPKLPETELDPLQANAEQRLSVTERPQSVADQPQAEVEQPQIEPLKAQASPEQPQVQPVLDPPAVKAAEGVLPTFELASLVEAVGIATGIDLPEAPFLHELPSRQDQPPAPLMIYATAPVLANVQLPANASQEPALRATRSLVLDVLPAQPPVELTPVGGPATWIPVPQGYPPVVVSASATLLLDSSSAKLIPLRMGEPCRGEGPVPTPQTLAIEAPVRQPRLPNRQPDYRPTPVFTPPPPVPAYRPLGEGCPGSGPALPPLGGVLRPQRDVTRLVPPISQVNFGALPSFLFFVAEPTNPLAPKELPVAAVSLLETTITPCFKMPTEGAPITPFALSLAAAPTPLPLEPATPLRSDPSFSEVRSTWLWIAVASHLPRATTLSASKPMGLNMAADVVPVGYSSVTNYPLPVETAAPVSSPLPLLLMSKPGSLAAPVMPFWSTTRPLSREAYRLPTAVTQQECDQSVAYLHPSLPSPMSLVTWSQSLSISIPACNPSNLGGPAPLAIDAIQGRTPAVRLWSPSGRGHRPTPLLPLPSGVAWTPVAPVPANLRPPAIKPIAPGNQGTAPPSLSGVRVQPASMPMLPPAAAPFEMEPVAGLVVLGLWPEDNLQVACIDMAGGISGTPWEPRFESHTVLPSLSAERQAPAMGLAPSSHQFWWSAMPPVQTVSAVQPFPALKRLAWSLTASLPETH
jgi:hypothetical protein